ncbi:MAG: DNA primase [Candidatus Latescibacteria bacterium]|nr:DNA primase [Candidatus Latescibacterota bacterium]
MPQIPQETIQRIREASDIVEVISDHVQLRKAGRNFVGLCPFHGEKTPSFNVNPELQFYKCFGCDAGGDVFKFIQQIDRVSFTEAVAHLAQRSGIALPSTGQQPGDELSDQLYRASDLAMKYYHHLLRQSEGKEALAYLQTRGISDQTIDRFGLGCAPVEWDAFFKMATRRQFDPAVLERAGLISARKEGKGYYDRFRERLIFPIANLSGRTIAFGARTLKADQQPKYLNSPETPIYHKSSTLYGLHQAREAIRQQDCVLVVEGYMDFLSLAQHGIAHAVASAGTALTEEHCRLLSRFARRVVLVFDGDEAGSAASLRGLEVVLATGLEAYAVSLPGGHDPDTLVQAEGPEALLALVGAAGSALDFHLGQLARQHDLRTLDGKARAAEAVQSLLARCRDAVRRDLLLREASQRLGIGEKAFRQQLQQTLRRQTLRTAQAPQENAPASQAAKNLPSPERTILGLLLQYPRFIGPTAQVVRPEVFADPRAQHLARLLFDEYHQAKELDLSGLMGRAADPELVQLISTCAMVDIDEAQVEQEWEGHVQYLQREALTRQIEQLQQELHKAVAARDETRQQDLQREHERLRKERQTLLPSTPP